MAQKKLLHILTIICCANCCFLWSLKAFGQEQDDIVWVNNLTQEAAKTNIGHFLQKLGEGKIYGEDLVDDIEDVNKNYELKIFVSSSMPVSLLRAYATEAALYGGTLVLKGLPGGEFKPLLKLVMDIEGNQGIVGSNIQIDQEAFETYSVTSVPVIVLNKDGNCLFKATCKQIFDKMVGNVGLRFALEKFAASGELKPIALEILAK